MLLLSLALETLGCSGSGGGDDPGVPVTPRPPPGSIALAWQPLTAGTNGTGVPAECPAGASSARVHVGNADRFYEQDFACGALGGTLAYVTAGTYDVSVRFTDDGGTRYAESPAQPVTVVANNPVTVDIDVFVDHGFYAVGWTLRAVGGAAVPCSGVAGENGVVMTATSALLLDSVVDCEDGDGDRAMTRPLPLGNYSLLLSIVDGADQVLGSSLTINPGALDYGNQIVDLGLVDIQLH